MDTKSSVRGNSHHKIPHVKAVTHELLKEGKKLANDLYKGGLEQVSKAEDGVKEYSDELSAKVRENPLRSLLIAGGIGVLLSLLLKK